jgi:DNA (cytosine-5)-methyltransferase 1
MGEMRVASVCSGIGGAELAFAGIAQHAFAAEIEQFPRAVLAHHFPGMKLYGDFTEIPAAAGPVDVLVGGTPCQSFSVAGLRGGMADARGNLALEFLRLAERVRARWVLWENVPGVLSSSDGRDFGAFVGGLAELGYGWAYRVLDAQYFGLAQRRRRVFVVGCLGDWRRAAAVLFEPASLRGDTAPGREERQRVAPTLSVGARGSSGHQYRQKGNEDALIARCLNAHPSRIDGESETFITAYRVHAAASTAMTGNGNAKAAAPVDVARALDTCGGFTAGQGGNIITHSLRADRFDASEDGTGRGTPLVALAFHQNQRAEVTTNDTAGALNSGGGKPGQGYPAIMQAFQTSQSGTRTGDVHATLDSNNGSRRHNGAISGSTVRRLTPTECERLQGFPDGWTDVAYRGKPAADGPRYRSLGNAFAVPVIRWIARRLVAEHLRSCSTQTLPISPDSSTEKGSRAAS